MSDFGGALDPFRRIVAEIRRPSPTSVADAVTATSATPFGAARAHRLPGRISEPCLHADPSGAQGA